MNHFYILYKIINKINGKFYIGVHKTNNIHDDYYGSGHNIKAAIKKYGIENFEKNILQIYTNSVTAFKKERELVTESLTKDSNCYNIKEGGHGGFDHVRAAGLHKSVLGTKVMHDPKTCIIKKVKPDEIQAYLNSGWLFGYSTVARKRMSDAGKVKIQTAEHKKKNSDTKKGCIIMRNTKTSIKKFVKKNEVHEYQQNGWEIHKWKFLQKYR